MFKLIKKIINFFKTPKYVEIKKPKELNVNKPQLKYSSLISDLEKNRDKHIAEKDFYTPKIETTKTGGVVSLKGKKFLLCKEGFEEFYENFLNEEYYDLIVDDGYLARRHIEREFIQYFHRWLMYEEVNEFMEKNRLSGEDVHVHHIDLTTTNNKIKNLEVMSKKDHKKLHIKLKFKGSNKDFEKWYKKKGR